MTDAIKFFSALVISTAVFATASLAQDTNASKDEPEELGLNLGEEVAADPEIGRPYFKEEHGDWKVRCVKAPEGNDPCQLYQLLQDANGNSVAEISLFPLPPGREAAAGATIGAPLETFLPRQITLSVDAGPGRRYPFTWCSAGGCFARVGMSAEDIASFKKGVAAKMTIVPLAAPKTTVDLGISLSGFTAGYEAVGKLNSQDQ